MARQRSPHEFNELRKKAEKVLAENGGKVSRISLKNDVQELNHELSVSHIELEMQNDELRRAREKIEEFRSRYLDLYENAPVGYLTFDENGVVTEMNPTAERLLGIERTFLLKKPFSFLIAPESQDVFCLHRRDLLAAGAHTCELMLKRHNAGGQFFHARLESVGVPADGTTVIRTVLTDITERTQPESAHETARRELERKVGERTAGPEVDIARTTAAGGRFRGSSVDVEELQRRLEKAEQTIEAIHRGEVDAVVVSGEEGSRAYTLEGADHPYRKIVEAMNTGAVTINEEGTIFYSNKAFSTMTGIPLHGLIGSSFKDLVIPEHLPLFLDFIARTGETETTAETALRGRKGKLFVRLAGSSQTIQGIERICIVIMDISDLKSAEDSLRKGARLVESERDRLMALIDSMNEGVWFAHPNGRVVLANSVARSQAAEAGIDTEPIFGSPSSALLSRADIFSPDGTPLEMERLMRVFQGDPFHGEEIAIRNGTTGEVFYRRVSANPIWDSEKRPAGVVLVVQDITAAKRAEEEKTHLEEHLRQAQKMEAIGTLAGGIAHDFNNMLAIILGNAELALDDVTGDTRRNIEHIVKASRRARDLVKQILTFSRKSAAGRTPLRLTPLVKETHKLLRGTLPSTIRMDLDIRTALDTVAADPSQIQQVLMNLATNAAYAMQEKGGSLTISLADVTFEQGSPMPDREMSAGTYVKLTVRDTGRGMTDSTRRRIFEPFFTTKPPGQGTGMGLAVVYGIVKGHDGAITVQSEPGKGSEFTIFLPHAGGDAAEETKEGDGALRGTERILLVDDEPLLVEMASTMLAGLGYKVTTAHDGYEALEMFFEDPSRFDLVITDETMPAITGISLAKKMLETRDDLPVILFTGYSETISPERAKAAGIREFVMKPVTKRELAETIRRVFDASTPSEEVYRRSGRPFDDPGRSRSETRTDE